MTTVVFPLSGNPFTLGHLNIVERASVLFDKVIVAIGNNVDKKYLLNQDERFHLTKKVLCNFKNVEVVSFQGLLVDFAYENKINLIVRGLRDDEHYLEELKIYSNGYTINKKIDTIFLPNQPDFPMISSTLVRNMIKNYVPCSNLIDPLVEKVTFFKIHNKLVLNVDNYNDIEIQKIIKNQDDKIKTIEIPESSDLETAQIVLRRELQTEHDIFLINNKSGNVLTSFETKEIEHSTTCETQHKHETK